MLSVFLVACGQSDIVENTDESNIQENAETDVEAANSPETTSASLETSNLSELTIHYMDVGQADATLFQYADEEKNYTILYDTGDWTGDEVVNYLEAQNTTYIDLVVVSHPDADHMGQLDDVMNNFEVGEVWLSGNESSSEVFQRGIEAVLSSEASYHEPRTGEAFKIGPMEIDVLYPEVITGKSNEESVSLLFTYGSNKFIFTGDAAKNDELQIMNSGIDINADILQLGHHGSDTSSDPAFIDAVDPSVAIYSAGEDNSYGHPSEEVVTLIEKSGIELYGTDVHGTIIVTSDGENYSIDTEHGGSIQSLAKPNESDRSKESTITNEELPSYNSCININTASVDEVQNIIHIGPDRAEDLIDLRPFQSIDDLKRINGLGTARIADIKSEGLACT